MRTMTWWLLLVPALALGGERLPARTVESLTLLYFQSADCGSCRRFEAAGVLDQVAKVYPALKQERVDVDAKADVVQRYGVEVTPTVVLVDAAGFPLGRPKLVLAEPDATRERIVALVGKLTKARVTSSP
jgi:thiol-disulfide isomerase/thioredoxin